MTLNTVAKIDALQAEYSAFETLHETDGLIDAAKELGVAYVAYSPLGHGWLVDDFPYKSPDDFAPDDFRRTGELSYAYETDSSVLNLMIWSLLDTVLRSLETQSQSSKERTSIKTRRLSRRSRSLPLARGALCPKLR